jgi:Flp pilus assembly protein TadG
MKAFGRFIRKLPGAAWREDRGAAAVEFALISPLLFLLLFGIIEFGRAWNVRQTLTDAAREGARVAVVNNNMMLQATLQDSVVKVVRNAATRAGLDLTKLTVNHTGVGTGLTANIQVEYQYVPMINLVLKDPITMKTASVMRNE